MADTYVQLGSSGNNTLSGSGVAVSGNGNSKKVTRFWLDYIDNGAYLANYGTTGGAIYFYVNGNHLMSANYTGSARPAVSWSGSLFIPAWTNITLSFQGSADNKRMRNAFRLWITYEDVASHPSVSAGSPVTIEQMSALHYFKYGSYNNPARYTTIYPWIFGSTGRALYASDYNNS